MKKIVSVAAFALMGASMLMAQNLPSAEWAYKVKTEGLEHSDVNALAEFMTDKLGSRLAASQMKLRSEQLVVEKLKEYGLKNVRAEFAADFARGGWDVEKAYAAMTAPYYNAFTVNPRAWTGGTNGPVKAEVVLLDVNTKDDLKKYEGKVTGKIVLMPSTATGARTVQEPDRYTDEELEMLKADSRARNRAASSGASMDMSSYMSRRQLQRDITEWLASQKPVAIINSSGSFNNTSGSGVSYKVGDPAPICQLNMPVEAHGRMQRLIRRGEKVEMELEIKVKFTDNQKINNVIAEIPGTDPKLKDEVVLIGAHLDSWHGGTGANDNASGCITMMEAMRILQTIGANPKRTIRIALWGGEEVGLYGSHGYTTKYLYNDKTKKKLPGFDKFALYLNMDNGSGRFRGIYLERNDAAVPFFETWMKPIESIGFTTLTLNKTGSTDHESFNYLGLPAYQFIQDVAGYDDAYHTIMDTYERMYLNDMKINAVITAWLAYCAAQDPDRIPLLPGYPEASTGFRY